MKIRKNDKVIVMKGKDKGKVGLVLNTFPKKGMLLVEGVNQYKKHQKGEVKSKGQLVTITKLIPVSKVMLVDQDKATRVGYVIEGNKKFRVAKKSGNKLINKVVEPKKEEDAETKTEKSKKSEKKSKSTKSSKKSDSKSKKK